MKDFLVEIFSHIKWKMAKCAYYLPICRNKIVFSNFNGKGYGCNPKYIAEELIHQKTKNKMYWIVEKKMKDEFPIQIKQIKKGSIQEIYHMATAKVWVDNVRSGKVVKKKKNQYYIQTWHGGIPLKKIEKDASEFIASWYQEEAQQDGKIMDIICASSLFERDIYKSAFWYNGEVVCCGLPRNALFFYDKKEKDKIINKVYKNIGIPYDKKIILYAPTFRDGNGMESFYFNYERVVSYFEKKLENEFVMVIRLHPNIQMLANKIEYEGNVYSGSEYSDMQELILASEILITDFSSCMFDFAIQNKLTYLFIKDYDKYIKEQRSLYFRIEELPFKCAKSENELIDLIKEYNIEEYRNNVDRFFKSVGCIEKGAGAKELVKRIQQKCSTNRL